MNRRLHNATLAATASGFLLAFGLMAADPTPAASTQAPLAAATPVEAIASPSDLPASAAAAPVSQPPLADVEAITHARAKALEARLDARARAFEARMERSAGSASIGDTVASAMAFAAEMSTEVALTSALGALEGTAGNVTPAPVDAALDERRRHARRVRGALAVPYFSFAQGLRGAGS